MLLANRQHLLPLLCGGSQHTPAPTRPPPKAVSPIFYFYSDCTLIYIMQIVLFFIIFPVVSLLILSV